MNFDEKKENKKVENINEKKTGNFFLYVCMYLIV